MKTGRNGTRRDDPAVHSGGGYCSGLGRKGTLAGGLLIFCALVVAFWEFMAARSRRGHHGYRFTGSDLKGFRPEVPGWVASVLPVRPTRAEPNIAVFGLDRKGAGNGGKDQVIVRLVHGYNMRDCMRLKGYAVELLMDTRKVLGNATGVAAVEKRADDRSSDLGIPAGVGNPELAVQVWRLISPVGDTALWVTSMLRTTDFEGTDVDVRSMPFPKIEGDDRPTGLPEGLTRESLRHPIRTFRELVRAKWNNARCDLATFLGLRTPAWASDELLTLVSASKSHAGRISDEKKVLESVLEAHFGVAAALRRWRQTISPVQ
ncbi:MAG: hypothetical protein N2255_03420 [Kiritimatiellae bacterium]|nr:hypothetical protein [Kiritimatiellia bacterium]